MKKRDLTIISGIYILAYLIGWFGCKDIVSAWRISGIQRIYERNFKTYHKTGRINLFHIFHALNNMI